MNGLEGSALQIEIAELIDAYFPAVGGGAAAVNTYVAGMPEVGFEILTNHLPGLRVRERAAFNCWVRRFLPTDLSFTDWSRPPFELASFPYKLLAEWSRFSRKLRYLEKTEFDLIHFNGPVTNFGFFRFDRLLGRPFLTTRLDFSRVDRPKVLTLHGIPSLVTESLVDVINEHRQIATFDSVVVVDRYMVPEVQLVAEESGNPPPVRFIPNAIDTDLFSYRTPIGSKKLKVGYLGRLDRAKAPGLLLKIARAMPDNMELHLAINGSPSPVESAFRRLERVRLTREIPYDQVPSFLGGIDLLFNPVLVPGVSRATLEAMSVGRPVIMSRTGDRYPLEDGDSGFLCELDTRSILSLLSWAAGERQLLEKMGRKGRDIILRRFDKTVVSKQLKEVFLEVAA